MCSTGIWVSVSTRSTLGGRYLRDGISATGAVGSAWAQATLHGAQGLSLSQYPVELRRLLPENKAVNARQFMPALSLCTHRCALTRRVCVFLEVKYNLRNVVYIRAEHALQARVRRR